MKQQGKQLDISQAGEVVAARAGDLGRIVDSSDGQRVKAIMEQDADRLKQAVQSGDMGALKQTFDSLMQTEEGSRLIGEIQKMMKK